MKDLKFAGGVLGKTAALLVIFNLAFAWLYPLNALGGISAYNHLFPGRKRLPYGDDPARSYNLTLSNLPAMFASHELSAPKAPGEFRVLLIGDSSTWGWLLPPADTLSEQMNRLAPPGSRLRVYNLGYPVMSLTKDVLLLRHAMRWQPDAIIWLVTLESFPYDKQLYSPLLQENAPAVQALWRDYGLRPPAETLPPPPNFWQRTIVGARRPLADLTRLQLYGIMWAATGIDQDIPTDTARPASDLSDDLRFHDLPPTPLGPHQLALNVLHAGFAIAGDTPLYLVNEPMFISRGKNSHLRYNFYYPRWAYDAYRQILSREAQQNGWRYLDLWDMIAPGEFTNSAVHLSPRASQKLAQRLLQMLTAAR